MEVMLIQLQFIMLIVYVFNIILGVEHKDIGPISHGTQTQWLRS